MFMQGRSTASGDSSTIYSCRQHVNMSAVDVCSEIENNDVNQSPRYFVHIILATVPLAHTSDLKARN
eukprot:288031-Prorocentrum_minimum.AAC.3